MRTRLFAPAITAALAATTALAAPTGPAAARVPPPPASVSVAGHPTTSGTALVSGQNRPGTRLRVASARTAAVRTLQIDYQVQETGWWCGPAATRIALSARTAPPSQSVLAAELGTTQNGTDHIGQVTGVLNAHVGTGWYETKEMPNDPPTQPQRDLLWRDVVLDIDNDYPIVANIVAVPGNQPPGYPPNETIYHYFSVIGYDDVQRTVLIADPASFAGNQIYWLSFDQLATLIPPKGYAA